MKLVIVLYLCFVASVYTQEEVKLIRSQSAVNPDSYNYVYELDDGQYAEESGKLINDDTLIVAGKFSYVSPEGQEITLTYVADENGFQPEGDHLPTPPPIPEHILKALEYIRTHPPAQDY